MLCSMLYKHTKLDTSCKPLDKRPSHTDVGSYKIPTMPAKGLGTLAMIYAIVELQNPLPRKTMLCKGDMNISASRSDAFLQR